MVMCVKLFYPFESNKLKSLNSFFCIFYENIFILYFIYYKFLKKAFYN